MLRSPLEDWEDWEFLEEIGPSGNSLELQMSPGAHCFSKVLQRAPESSGVCTASKKKNFQNFYFISLHSYFIIILFIHHLILVFHKTNWVSVRDGARSSVAGVGEHWDQPYA